MYPHTNRESSPLDQPCGLQCRLHPAVTQLNTVQLAQFLVKVLHVEVEVLLPGELQHLLHRFHRNPLRARTALAIIPQPAIAVRPQPLPPAPHRAVRHAHNLRCFPTTSASRPPPSELLPVLSSSAPFPRPGSAVRWPPQLTASLNRFLKADISFAN